MIPALQEYSKPHFSDDFVNRPEEKGMFGTSGRMGWWCLGLSLVLGTGIVILGQSPVTNEEMAGSPNAEWLTYGGDHAETHFSPLDQIDRSNVARLGLAWEWEIVNTQGNLEATPLVRDGVIYATGTWSNVFAVDARTGEQIWRWDPGIVRSNDDGGPSVCCGPVNRGLAMHGDKVFAGLLDGRLVALNRYTGLVEWVVQTTPLGLDYSITGAPRVFDSKVVIGNSGAEFGVRGYITAYDVETGDEQWRFYTVPGNPAAGFENEAMERAAETWNGEWWLAGGGGTVWDGYAYDPEENLLYVGTGNGSPWSRDIRSPGGGDNLYLSSILALDADTGRLEWYYQTTPGDHWDYTAVQPLMLLDLEIDGRERKVIVQAPKNGFFYVVDRVSGAFISGQKYADDVTWASAIDQETGRPIENLEARYTADRGAWVSPGPGGAHNWHPMSFNPETGYVYFPASNSQMFYSINAEYEYRMGQTNMGITFGGRGRGGDAGEAEQAEQPEQPELTGTQGGMILAWDPVANREVWRIERGGGSGGTLSTAGGLVFWSGNGRFNASDAVTGDVMWTGYIGGNVATPVSYELDGRQYIVTQINASGGFGGRGGRGGGRGGGGGGPQMPARMAAFVLDGEALPDPPPAPEDDAD
jgi:PQQ-dependent dehydrogenase (methanol/ethanol family)